MSTKHKPGPWFVGANGNEFADMGGGRYCVQHPARGGAFTVYRNGAEIAGPQCLSGPAGFVDADSAKRYAEQHAEGGKR